MSRIIEELRRLCGVTPNVAEIDRKVTAASGLPVVYASEAGQDIIALNRRLNLFIDKGNLPAIAEVCRQSAVDRVRLSNGRSACETALDALLAPFHRADDPEQCEDALFAFEAWWQQDRGHPAAAGVYAQALALTGFAYRGENWASEVSDSQWAMLRDYANRALAVLERAGPSRETCWIWNRCNFQVKFIAFGVAEATRHDVTVAFDSARRMDPLEVSLYEDRVVQLLPRWGGSFDALEQLARQSYAITHRHLGAEMYARIYDCVARYEQPSETLVDYYLMRDGFQDWLRRVPSQALANRFAAHAHAAGDVVSLSQIFRETLTEIQPQQWFGIRQPLLAWEAVSRAHASRH